MIVSDLLVLAAIATYDLQPEMLVRVTDNVLRGIEDRNRRFYY